MGIFGAAQEDSAHVCVLQSVYRREGVESDGDRLQAPRYLTRVDNLWKIRARKQRTDIGKYSFVNSSITDRDNLPTGAIGTYRGKTRTFKTRVS